MAIDELQSFRYRGARALVLLHERALRKLLPVWRRARAASITLPATKDPDYASPEALLHHVFDAARGYLIWLCDTCGLPDPGVDPAPEASRVEQEAERWMENLLASSRASLAAVRAEQFDLVAKSRWGVDISVESMFEHAVMHPERHRFQLEELLEAQGRA